jgi:hypothetical protein
MKVVLTDVSNIRRPEVLTDLLQKRIMLLLNRRISNKIGSVVFKEISTAYEVFSSGEYYSVIFSNDVLLKLIKTGSGLADFDKHLKDIENYLIRQL